MYCVVFASLSRGSDVLIDVSFPVYICVCVYGYFGNKRKEKRNAKIMKFARNYNRTNDRRQAASVRVDDRRRVAVNGGR